MSRPHEASIQVASHAGPAAAAAAAAGPEPGGGIASSASPKIDPRVQQALTWTRMAPGGVLPPPRSGAASVVVKGGLYMFGGYGGGTGRLDDFYCFDFEAKRWSQASGPVASRACRSCSCLTRKPVPGRAVTLPCTSPPHAHVVPRWRTQAPHPGCARTTAWWSTR